MSPKYRSIPNVILFGIYSELFYNLRDLIIAKCCNIRIIETKFGAPGNKTPHYLDYYKSYAFGTNVKLAPLLQYRLPVGFGPSSKT